MKFFDKSIPKIHRSIALLYNEIGEERARKILDVRAKQRAFDAATGKTPPAPPPSAAGSYAQAVAEATTPKASAVKKSAVNKGSPHILVTPKLVRKKDGTQKEILKKVTIVDSLPLIFNSNGFILIRDWSLSKTPRMRRKKPCPLMLKW